MILGVQAPNYKVSSQNHDSPAFYRNHRNTIVGSFGPLGVILRAVGKLEGTSEVWFPRAPSMSGIHSIPKGALRWATWRSPEGFHIGFGECSQNF